MVLLAAVRRVALPRWRSPLLRSLLIEERRDGDRKVWHLAIDFFVFTAPRVIAGLRRNCRLSARRGGARPGRIGG
jgi:hypothetical protein